MATVDELAELRLLTDTPEDEPPWTDDYLGSLIDQHGVNGAAVIVWRQKAARYASFVDMTESGSSRKLSQMRDAALEMATNLGESSASISFTHPIERA